MRRRICVVLAAGIVAFIAAVEMPSAANAHRDLESVTYATSFGNFGRDAYVYVAIDKGYFREAGLDVKVVPGAGTSNAQLLASGAVDYMANDVSGSALQLTNNNLPIRVVAVTSQNSQSAIVVLASSPITTPQQLAGHTIADTPSSIGEILFPYYAKKAAINASKVTYIPATPQTIPALLVSGKVDAVGQFTVGIPTLQKAAGGAPMRSFKYSKYLPGLLGNGIWTTEDRINTNPDQVKRFVGAVLKGLNFAMDNPGATGYILQKYVPLADPIVAAHELRILKPFVENSCTKKYGVGYIDVGKMKTTSSLIASAFHPTNPLAYNDIYSAKFVKTATCASK
jgi:NitT/TauT family transport system substrate-binding protein